MPSKRRQKTEDEKRRDRMASAPQWYFGVCEELAAGAMAVRVHCGKENFAVNLRQRFHLFRKDLVYEHHPLAETAVNTMLTVEDAVLIFNNTSHIGKEIGQAIEAVMEELPKDGAPAVFTQPAGPDDPAEALIQKTYGVLTHEQKECEHELDATGAFCLKCQLPADLCKPQQ